MGVRFSAPLQTGPGAHPASCTLGTGSFPGVKSSRGVTLIPRPLLVPWSRKSIAIPLLPLWAVRPVQRLNTCTVELYLYSHYWPYGLYRTSVSLQCCTLPLVNFIILPHFSTHFGPYFSSLFPRDRIEKAGRTARPSSSPDLTPSNFLHPKSTSPES